MKRVFTQLLIPKKSVGFLPGIGGMCLFLFASFLAHAHERDVPGLLKMKSARLELTIAAMPGPLLMDISTKGRTPYRSHDRKNLNNQIQFYENN